MNLGDAFPINYRDQFAHRSIAAGSVFYMHVTDTIPPKVKFFVVAATTGDFAGIVYINSNNNAPPHLASLQVPISRASNVYLHYDSYADCSRVYRWPFGMLRQRVSDDPTSHVGSLDPVCLQCCLGALSSARTISMSVKREFGLLIR